MDIKETRKQLREAEKLNAKHEKELNDNYTKENLKKALDSRFYFRELRDNWINKTNPKPKDL